MLNFERSSLNKKLTIISFLSTGTALFFVFIAFAVTSVLGHRKDEGMQLSSFAGVIGTNSVDALMFNDRDQATATLSALKAKVEISNAVLFDRKGKLFARYVRNAQAEPEPSAPEMNLDEDVLAEATRQGSRFWSSRMRLYRPVINANYQVGIVMIEADLTLMWLDILKSLGVIAAAMGGSLLMSLMLASRFKASIADPVAKLINAAQKVSASQNYNLRIAHERTDEMGTLIDSFNAMLAQIEGRGAALTHHRDELERQVSVRTEQLEKAKNAAEAASRAKSAFLATMSHEIRTPMNGVLGMTEMLLSTALNDTQRNYTKLVKRSGEHLLVIINDILDFSKIEAGKLSIEYINFNLWDLLDDINTIYTPQAQAKGIALDFAIANDIPIAICGDPNRLRQIMANLIGNALKFTDRGQILAKVDVETEDGASVGLRFEVHDTGIGVSREARSRIFDAFSQADSSTTRKYGGTGLGLAISRQLVELMGGTIGVDNAPTQGSIFWFTVSFDKRRVDPNMLDASLRMTEGMRVLIVDEQADSRASLEHQLAEWQVASDSAVSARDAVDRLLAASHGGRPYEVAIIDMDLERTSGLSLAAGIKGDPTTSATRIMLISDNRLAADPVQRREAGVAYQLIKPARAADLFECIMTRPRGKPAVSLVPAPAAHAPLAPAGRKLRRQRVLLAEDNPVNVEVATAMLDSLGLGVYCARNGAEALAAARTDGYDVVLMDCQMPVMDGFAATAEIRRHERECGRARTLPIIAITANALQGDQEACLAAGMDDYLSKPFSQQELAAVLGRWIALPLATSAIHGGAAMAPPPAAPPPPVPPAVRTDAAPRQAGPHDAVLREVEPRPPGVRLPATPGAVQRDVINRHALENIRALSKERGDALVQKVIAAYVDDTPQHLRTLRQAITGLDPGNLRKVAHSLKSSSANVGAETLAQMCKDMETLGRTDTTEGASGILTDMEREFQAVCHSLNALLEKEH
ncbi:hybrid sensor histidine kinase/response regulator [Massilia antarctica]|uniref:hybrid sensor histidine kinase/response regulator n=1 Tax=Massilia antarctica TaxID=2765360 RepID=UPI0006BB6CA8|nr:response regulator [Massilia sp. H27-R4]MCY0914013.1 response regulator [Massilia sp. H27-R4]CUI04244.1 multi-sensor hybrid histidine kinase [Janthinobacterium sp. CG23_2]CUU28030.1 multi-sensor hybrid histidine kinase [Janthinobacterium sp. CG23_2]